MSAINLSAAVASLQPGTPISPESALKSWTVINDFNHNMGQLTGMSCLLTSSITILLAISIASTLHRAYMPTAEKTDRTYSTWDVLKSAISVALRVYLLIQGTSMKTNFGFFHEFFRSTAIADLQFEMTTSYTSGLYHWKFLKEFAEYCPKLIVFAPNLFIWMGIAAAVACGATLSAVRSQAKPQEENYSSIKQGLDITSVVSLGLASLVALCGFVYAKNYSTKMLPSI